MKFADWNIEELTGYKPLTTFYMDFSLSEPFGETAIQDTYDRCFEEWKTNYKYLTEFVMVLNWKIWEHYNKNDNYSNLYNALWEKTDLYATQHLKNDELLYFYSITD